MQQTADNVLIYFSDNRLLDEHIMKGYRDHMSTGGVGKMPAAIVTL